MKGVSRYFKELASADILSFLIIFEKNLKAHIKKKVKESDKNLFVDNKLDEFLLYSLYTFWKYDFLDSRALEFAFNNTLQTYKSIKDMCNVNILMNDEERIVLSPYFFKGVLNTKKPETISLINNNGSEKSSISSCLTVRSDIVSNLDQMEVEPSEINHQNLENVNQEIEGNMNNLSENVFQNYQENSG